MPSARALGLWSLIKRLTPNARTSARSFSKRRLLEAAMPLSSAVLENVAWVSSTTRICFSSLVSSCCIKCRCSRNKRTLVRNAAVCGEKSDISITTGPQVKSFAVRPLRRLKSAANVPVHSLRSLILAAAVMFCLTSGPYCPLFCIQVSTFARHSCKVGHGRFGSNRAISLHRQPFWR